MSYRRLVNGMLMEGPSGGLPDALWRTSLADIAYGPYENRFYKGIKSCIFDPGVINGIKRHPEYYTPNTSRDAIVMMLTAMYIRDKKEAQSLAEDMPFKISSRFMHTIGTYDFVKFIAGRSKGLVASIECIFTVLPRAILNRPLKWMKVTNEKWYPNFYSVHLAAWMMYLVKPNLFSWLAKMLILMATPRSNLLIRYLCGKSFNVNDLVKHDIEPRKDWQWQRLPWVKYHGIDMSILTWDESGWAYDVSILYKFMSDVNI